MDKYLIFKESQINFGQYSIVIKRSQNSDLIILISSKCIYDQFTLFLGDPK